MDKWDPNWNKTKYADRDNYWAGAKKACDELGMSLPDYSKLESIYQAGKKDSSLGLPTTGRFWSSEEALVHDAIYMSFDTGYSPNTYKYFSGNKVLCVGD